MAWVKMAKAGSDGDEQEGEMKSFDCWKSPEWEAAKTWNNIVPALRELITR